MISAFHPISLAEINAEAAMLTRVDRKYLLHRDELNAVVEQIPTSTKVLTIAGERWHRYHTVYFDTPDLLSYRMTAQKRRHRFKVRTRTYLDTGDAFCEVKVAGPRGVTVKTRVPVPIDVALDGKLPESARDWVDATLRAERIPVTCNDLYPALVNNYSRATICPTDFGRATIDTGLVFAHPECTLDPSSGPDVVFIETKSGNRPSDVDRLLWRLGHRPTRVSKFGTGMATLRPHLLHNRWTPVMREYFSATSTLPVS